ncbi:MAG: hypothetical protein AAGC74_03530 [Verrucomicrobiota bacterium]
MKKFQRKPHFKRGYASLLVTITLSLSLMAISLTTLRRTRQMHSAQSTTQVRLDYNQKERAFLRALLDIVPNTSMRLMMHDSENNPDDYNWETIFTEALNQADINGAMTDAERTSLGLADGLQSANTGDANYSPGGLITCPGGAHPWVFPSTSNSAIPAELAALPMLNYQGNEDWKDTEYPIISFEKVSAGTGNTYDLIPYPEIQFGYSSQGQNFIAKRNWWAFTLNFGANTSAISGIAPDPRTYVLSIYEVPTQLAISSSGSTTSLGEFEDGTDWNNISIQGTVYARKASMETLTGMTSVASREGVTRAGVNPLAADAVLGGVADRREFRATNNTFHPYSSSSDSGMVSFTPINRGWDFFDYFAEDDDSNRVGTTGWHAYTIGAQQTKLKIDVSRVQGASNQLPNRLLFRARYGNDSRNHEQQTSRGAWWNYPGDGRDNSSGTWSPGSPPGDEWPIQSDTLTVNGRPCLTLDLEKLPAFLDSINADPITVNNSLWIGPRYEHSNDGRSDNTNVTKTNFPTLDTDISLIITKSADLSAYTNGFTIITPMRVYFADDFNTVPTTPPAGSGITGDWYPPVSVFSPEKRFGITDDPNGKIELTGQVGYLPSDAISSTINPLDLKGGGNDAVNAGNITANLLSVQNLADLFPINSMNWMTVIEEVH